MSRLATLARNPRRTLATLGTVVAAVGVTYASGADFTAQSANPANTFSTGTLTMSNSAENAAVFTASNLRPGDATTGTVDIANTGSLSAGFSLVRGAVSDSDAAHPLSAKLTAQIVDCGAFTGATAPTCDADDQVTYDGTLAAMNTAAGYQLGSFAADEKHRYRFQVTLAQDADNNYQGDSTTVAFAWNAA
jgi:spore coat-associated protein N